MNDVAHGNPVDSPEREKTRRPLSSDGVGVSNWVPNIHGSSQRAQ